MLPRSTVEWLLEAVAITGAVASVMLVLANWQSLPTTIPTHFNFSGEPNAWGSRKVLWLLPALNVFTYVLLTVATRYQRLVNIPFKVDRDSPEVRQIIRRMMIVLKAGVLPPIAWLVWRSIETAQGRAAGLGGAFVAVFLALVMVPVFIYNVKLWRFRVR